MTKNVLKDFETFNEFPNNYLCINKDSNYFYVVKDNKAYITKRNAELISYNGKDATTYIYAFYDVIDGKLVLKQNAIENDQGLTFEKAEKAIIISLSKVLNTTNNQVYYLDIDDIITLLSCSNEKEKKKRR